MFNISGVILDTKNKPVENATVVIRNRINSLYDLSDEFGLFNLNNIEEGKYELIVLHRSHHTVKQQVDVDSDLVIDILATTV